MTGTPILKLLRILTLGALLPWASIFSAHASEIDGREAIGEAACRSNSFDHQAHFQTPVRAQGSQGQCFAFASVGLLEEHFCATDSRDCGIVLSPIDAARDYPDRKSLKEDPPIDGDIFDVSRDYFNLQNSNQGGREYQVLDAAMKFGICEEKHAPYFPKLEKKCRNQTDRSSCVIDGLKSVWRKYHRLSRNLSDPYADCLTHLDGKPLSAREERKIESVLEAAGAYLEHQVDGGLDLTWELNHSYSEFDFVKKVLIPPSCQENRLMTPAGRVWHQSWESPEKHGIRWNELAGDYTTSDLTNVERLTNISAKVRSTGRSVALGLCANMARVNNRSRVLPAQDRTSCGPHALIANGVQWNAVKRRCEIHIRNS
jgi:hypothetical protein